MESTQMNDGYKRTPRFITFNNGSIMSNDLVRFSFKGN